MRLMRIYFSSVYTFTCRRWVPYPFTDDTPFSQIHWTHYKLEAFSIAPRSPGLISDRQYTCHSSALGSILKVSLSSCICPPFQRRRKKEKDLLKIRSQVMGPDDSKRKKNCRIYCLLLQLDLRNNCCGTRWWVSSCKPVPHINYLIRRSQWLYKLSRSFVLNGLCVHIKPPRRSYTSQERG